MLPQLANTVSIGFQPEGLYYVVDWDPDSLQDPDRLFFCIHFLDLLGKSLWTDAQEVGSFSLRNVRAHVDLISTFQLIVESLW